ncbi:CvpA family protein [Maribacter chungangensis]|uniref:CvpA family protein n=1 Tax=Maribacter chungangensis TaxID=1069117 RepID=A0ABW3B8C6_9FLAO
MALLDIILGLLLLLGLWKGFNNGLLIELASIVALIAGIYGAIHFSYITGDYLTQQLNWEERYVTIAAFIVTFVLIVVAVHFAGKLLTKVANIALLGLLNKIAGAIFGTLKVAVILGAILIFFNRVNTNLKFISEEAQNESVLFNPIKEIGALVFDTILRKELAETE